MRSIRIPSDRVGALVGKDGSSKKMIEERTGIKLSIDREGEVVWNDNAEGVEPIMALKIIDVVKAIGRGFNPDKALKLLDDDDMYFESIDIKDIIGDRQSQVQRARGRLIGKAGQKARIITYDRNRPFIIPVIK